MLSRSVKPFQARQGIKEVYYDRNGFTYAGRIKALADGVREKGVKF